MNKGVTRYLGAFIVTALVSLTGSLDIVAKFFLNLSEFVFTLNGRVDWLNELGFFSIILAIILFGLIIFAFSWIVRKLKQSVLISTAERQGLRTNNSLRLINLRTGNE